jgi:hypothetical protein
VRRAFKYTLGIENAEDEDRLVIDRAHRVGLKQRNSKPRGIIVKFGKWKNRQQVLSAARKPRKAKNGGETISISEDFSRESGEVRKGLMQHMEQTRKQHKNAVLMYEKIVADGKTYMYDNSRKKLYTEGRTTLQGDNDYNEK